MSDAPDHPEHADPGVRLGSRRPRVMAQSAVLDEEGSPRLFRRAAVTLVVAVLTLAAWAGFLTVDDTVSVAGAVVPGGEVKVVRHADGGTVAEVLVKKGERVEEGQILLRLTPEAMRDELDKIKVRRAGVGLLAAGLKALGSGREPDYAFALPDHQDQVEKARVIFENLKTIAESQRRAVEGQVRTLKAELEDVGKRQQALSKNTDILEEELQFREELFKKGLTDKGVYTETKNQVEKAYNDLAEMTAERQRINKALTDAERRLNAFDVRLRGNVVRELLNVDPALEKLNDAYKRLNERVSRLTVSAPAGGIVRAAKLPAVGATLEPGTVILDVVPLAGEMAIEARLPAKDLDRVVVGMAATVKATSGGSAGVAGIPGRLIEIAEAPTTDDRGRVYHKAVVAVGDDPTKPAPAQQRLTPGTSVEVAIKIGSRPLYARLMRQLLGG